MSGIEVETDIWSRQGHAPTATTVYQAPIKLEGRSNGPQLMMMTDGEGGVKSERSGVASQSGMRHTTMNGVRSRMFRGEPVLRGPGGEEKA